MMEGFNRIVILIIVFLSLYISVVWLSFLYLYKPPEKKSKKLPSVTIAIPAYNEEKSIADTIRSVSELNYPKMKIIVIDDGSTDNTVAEIKRGIKEIKSNDITLLTQENRGKGSAINAALKISSSEIFGIVDADSRVDPDSLIKMVPYLEGKTAAVISCLQVNKPKNIYERVQRIEYIIGILTRRLMAFIGTLAITPGVLSIYQTKILKKLGGFDEKSKTEDFEVAMRLKYNGYNVEIEKDAYTYTNVPRSFMTLWHQRIRWFRGFIENHIKYKDMFFRSDSFGWFQLPLNILGIFMLVFAVAIMLQGTITYISDQLLRFQLIDGYLSTYFLSFTNPRDYLLGLNMRLMIPIYIALAIAVVIFYIAHKSIGAKVKYPGSIIAYFFIMPFIYFLHWVGAITQELFQLKRKW